VFHRLHKTKNLMTLILTLLAHGCLLQAVVVAFGLDERTVKAWLRRRDNIATKCMNIWCNSRATWDNVQADEIRAKMQNAVLWLVVAVQV